MFDGPERGAYSLFRAQTGRVTHQERLHVPNIGLPELAIVLIIALVVFGPKRLPEMGRQLGRTLREFKSATSDIRSQIGIDDIADSVNDLKSGLSLTSDSPHPTTETVAGAAAGAAVGAAVGGEPAASTVVDSAASTPTAAPAPAMADTVSTDVPPDAGTDADAAVDDDALTVTDEPVDGSDYTVGDEPVDGSSFTIADEPVDGSTATVADEAVDGNPAAVVADAEGDVGVEAFGSLTRGSASSSGRTAAD
jgi:sec-independent protein translocase protein TatA